MQEIKELTSTSGSSEVAPTGEGVEVKEPIVAVPDIKEELVKLKAEFEQRLEQELKNERRHFKQVADQQSARFQSAADRERQKREGLEAQLTTIEQQYFESLDPQEQNKLLRQKLQAVEKRQQVTYEPPPSPTSELSSPKQVLDAQVRALGIDPADSRIDWAEDDATVAGVQRFYGSLMKIQQEKLQEGIKGEIDKIKQAARDEVEREHEVGRHSKVDTGGVPAGGAGGKRYKRSEVVKLMENPLSLTAEQRAEFRKAFEENRVYE